MLPRERSAEDRIRRELKRDNPWRYYTKGAKLGKGAFGTVCVVTKKSTGRKFACKEIDTMLKGFTEDMFTREIGAMLKVASHPHVIAIEDIFRHGTCAARPDGRFIYVIMELVPSPPW